MTPLEMHIEFEQSVNQVGANRKRKYEPDEIDWILNKMQDRFIRLCLKSRENSSFEVDELNADAIQPLIVSGYTLVPYLDGTTRYKCFLPANYLYLLSDSSVTKNLCKGETAKIADRTIYINGIRQSRTAKDSAPFYETNNVTIQGTIVNVPADLPYGNIYTGYNSKDDLIFLVPFIVSKTGWYWEKAYGISQPNFYLQVTTTAPSGNKSITIDGTATSIPAYSSTLSLQVHTNSGTLKDNRLISSDKVKGLHGSAHYKSTYYSPISELAGDVLYIYGDSSFIVSSALISYVRKPQTISLSLNTNCELPESSCQTICDLAVEYVKGAVENTPGMQLKERDISKRVII